MKNHTKFTALITTTLLTVALAGPANATEPVQRETSTIDVQPEASIKISADSAATITFVKSPVQTTPARKAPVEPVYPTATDKPAPIASQAIAEAPPSQKYATQPVKAPVAPAAAVPAPAVSASGKGAAIASAAYAQLGVAQDCTMLVTNSLRAVGINFRGWPAEYLALGTVVPASEAQAGDLAYYADGGMGRAHIGVYVGNGKAVHGGWNGGSTVLFSVNVGTGPVFIRVA